MRSLVVFAMCALLVGCAAASAAVRASHAIAIRVSFPASIHRGPLTGRVYVVFTKTVKPHPPLVAVLSPEDSPPFFAIDVNALDPGRSAVIGSGATGYPLGSIRDLPPGDYYVEAFANPYIRYHRADGHTVWAHKQWDPQLFSISPGNLHSAVRKLHVDPASGVSLDLRLDQTVSPAVIDKLAGGEGYATDTPWIKHLRILSPTLTKFWGRPAYLGATILLPKGYASHPHAHYPIVYNQGHYYQPVPWDFTTDKRTETPQAVAAAKGSTGTGYEFYEAWSSAHFPRFLMATFQHPCPFFDDSYAVNSANCGPFGDALMKELIPYIETHYRVIRHDYARLVEGGSTGGWESLALQLQHPRFFGGAYVFCPDFIDFRQFGQIDAYKDKNAFGVQPPGDPWHTYLRPWSRTASGQVLITQRQLSQYELAAGSNGRSTYQLDGWWAIFDPVGADGYPVPMWNMRTGTIDHNVVRYMRSHGYDLTNYMQTRWPQIGPDLTGKLKFWVGDMDNYYLNLAVYQTQDFLKAQPAAKATFAYGRPMKGHGWHPMTWASLLNMMAAQVRSNTPHDDSTAQWNY